MSAAARYFDTVGRVNVAMNDTSATDNMIPILIVLALVVVFYHYVAAGKKTDDAMSEVEKLEAELRHARHLIAIMRNGDYVSSTDVPPSTPHPDTVFQRGQASPAATASGAAQAVATPARVAAAVGASGVVAAASSAVQASDAERAPASPEYGDWEHGTELSEEEAAIAALDRHMPGA